MPRLVQAAVLLLATVAAAAAQQTPAYQIHRDVIRGRVTTDSGAALAGADIAITMAPDRNTQFAKSDTSGRYEVVFERGTGDYLVHVAAPTKQAFRKRVVRAGSDSVFTVDAVLKPLVQQLAAVQVQARRQRPTRDAGSMGLSSVGAAEQVSNGVNGRIAPDQAGNLDAIAASMPGVAAAPGGGISVLGLPPSQNSTMLNGLAFGGGSVPRGASTVTRVSTSTYDPARGGFSGALTQVTLSPGNQFTQRRAFLTLDAPQLQSADVVARRSGATYGAIDLNVGTQGSTNFDRWVYNGGLEYKRQTSDAVSLTDADVDVLEHAGVARDSVARLFAELNALGIPAGGAGIPSSRVMDHVAFLGRLDRPLFDFSTFTPKNTTWGLTGFADYTRRGALSFGPTATPAHGGESTQLNAGGQFIYSAYFGKLKDELTDFHTGVSVARSTNSPYLRLPDGRVLVSSQFDDGTGGIASLSFAGNSLLESSRRTVTWQTTNETQFYWRGHAGHRGKVYAESRLDGFSEDPASDRLGSFTFNSLADLQANRPAT
ncbi:MAG TPA: carboxypeptidase-like regulatory domain-containing protein, partial [Gemmatimonadaceae bacterium]|nr:carboxypeptidase-like regulatory domain-containing protein [Gemmatimonadaceae bacterium]